ncbi:MAG: InlB B-repeat-containing protein, partial [Erysipelotrichaceae bacterium]|nr:InlB B-repeat-containing protein [Erysipelotrichaceae bacterium]
MKTKKQLIKTVVRTIKSILATVLLLTCIEYFPTVASAECEDAGTANETISEYGSTELAEAAEQSQEGSTIIVNQPQQEEEQASEPAQEQQKEVPADIQQQNTVENDEADKQELKEEKKEEKQEQKEEKKEEKQDKKQENGKGEKPNNSQEEVSEIQEVEEQNNGETRTQYSYIVKYQYIDESDNVIDIKDPESGVSEDDETSVNVTLETITGYIVKLNEGEDEATTKRTYTIDTTKDVNEFVIEYEKVEESSGEVVEEETVEPTAEPVGEEMATYAEASYIINEEGIAEITIKVIDELYAENENLNLLFAELPENVEYAYDNEVSWTFYTATNGEYTFTFTVFDNWDEIQTETSTITVEGVTGELEDEEELEISLYKRGNGGSTARDTTRVYIYVKLNPVGNVDTSNWVVNKDGWYTIGYIDIPVSKVREIDPSVDYAERKDIEYTPKAAAYVNANASSITYYNDFVKSAFKLEDTEWNASGYGLKSCNGATSYSKEEYSPYAVNGLNWHLDGLLTLKAEKTYTATVTFQYSDGVTENRPALQSNYEQNGLHANDKFSYATNNIDGFTKTISYNGTTIDAITDIVVYANDLTFIVTYTPKNYTITYVLNGGTTSENTVFSRDYGTDFPTIDAPSKVGYTFDGWYSDVELMNKVETLPGKVTGNVTYYAKWIENDDITINYEATTGGSVTPGSEELAPATGVAQGSTATASAGYHFVNWTNAAG